MIVTTRACEFAGRFLESCRRAATLSAITLAALAALISMSATRADAQIFAQQAMGNEGAISKRSVQLYCKILNFDKDQSETALLLHEGYLSEHKRVQEEMQGFFRKIQEEFEESKDFTIWQKEVPKKQMEFAKQMESHQKAFLDDLKGLCDPKQEERWPSLERHRRRETYLRFQFVAGVAVDVVDCVRRVGMAPEEGKAPPDVAEALEQYEFALDRKLVEVERMAKDAESKAMDMAMGGNFQQMMEMMKKFSDEAILIRNINRENARRVSALLSDDVKGTFDKEIQRRSFPRVYRKSYVERAIDSAEKFKDLDADQKRTIGEIKAAYTREAAPLNERWASAITEQEDKEGSSFLGMFQWDGQAKDTPVTQARKARRDIDNQFRDRLMAVLKEDQRRQLPKEDVLPPGAEQQMDMMDFDLDTDDSEE